MVVVGIDEEALLWEVRSIQNSLHSQPPCGASFELLSTATKRVSATASTSANPSKIISKDQPQSFARKYFLNTYLLKTYSERFFTALVSLNISAAIGLIDYSGECTVIKAAGVLKNIKCNIEKTY